jgi:hypothetical protein
MKKALLLSLVVLAVFGVSSFALAADAPKGCGVANCHALGTDWPLVRELQNVKGHPAVAADALYADCLKCHRNGTPLALGPVLHQKHYHEGTNHFTGNKANNCRSCHALDLKTGKVSLVYAK